MKFVATIALFATSASAFGSFGAKKAAVKQVAKPVS